MSSHNPYQPGGTLAGNSYIAREADERLQKAIFENAQYPFFLASRQSGKSSVLARTQFLLGSTELRILIVDLSEFSPNSLQDYQRFVAEFINDILDQIDADTRLRQAMVEAENRPRFLLRAIRSVLESIAGRFIVCIDEVDVLTGCPFKDEFLSQVRALFNRRSSEKILARIQFVLAGAAPGGALISDPRRSPFNIGEHIYLDDLSFEGVKQLVRLGWPANNDVLDEIATKLLFWTSGSAYLCQHILYHLFEQQAMGKTSEPLHLQLEQVVSTVIKEAGRTAHFTNIARLLNSNSHLHRMWRNWVEGEIPDDITIGELSIIGICRRNAPFKNRLYEWVFGHRGPLSLLGTDPSEFEYDVFISHSPRDKGRARELADRLRHAGLRVWFDDWEIKPGDNIPAKLERGLSRARTMALCMSESGLGSDWFSLERQTTLFRDPLNSGRRFIPIRLDDSPIPRGLEQFVYIDWRQRSASEFERLLAACQGQISMSERHGNKPEIVNYATAKVLLVGDSGTGKTALAMRLASNPWQASSSTTGAWATQWKLPVSSDDNVEREIWLWDFGGQYDYRLVHQVFMDDAAAAVLIFDPQNENPFEGLGQWDMDLRKATRKPLAKLLVAGRVDRGGLVVSRASLDRFMAERGFQGPLYETSAKTGHGCDALREAIIQSINWKDIPEITSPALFRRMKQEILRLRDSGLVLIRLAELKQRMEMALPGERFKLEELQAVLGLLAGPGMIQRMDFGGFILLRPEVLSRYAEAVVRKVRKHPQELGCIREDELLAGNLDYQDFERLPPDDEAVVMRALHETFVSRAWCLRQPYGSTALLTFPSYFRRERPEQPKHPNVLATYRFTGPADDIYATLVVLLHHTETFVTDQLWKFAADFTTQTDKGLGLKLTREAEGSARLEVYFNPDVEMDSRVIFERYVFNHLTEHAQDVERLRHYACTNKKCDAFGEPFSDRAKIDKALAPGGRGKVFCPDCGKPINLLDALEQKFHSPAVKERARQLQLEGRSVIDSESRELLAVHHAGFIVTEAGQIYRGYTRGDHGIDGEIEFKDDRGRATGRRLYLQLKAGDSYQTSRRRDGAEVFQVREPLWADYWQQQAFPVMLVLRGADGEFRWMDVTSRLKRGAGRGGHDAPAQFVFEGERFDVMSVRRRRDEALQPAAP